METSSECVAAIFGEIVMTYRQSIVHPGQRVLTTDGIAATVAFVYDGKVFVYGKLDPVEIVGDCWGGEYDQELGLTA